MVRKLRTAAPLLILAIVLTLTACAGSAGNQTGAQTAKEGTYAFRLGEALLVPGERFDASRLPKPDDVIEIPDDGESDTQYSFGDIEVTTHKIDGEERIVSIYFMKNTAATAEGVTVGDTLDKVIAAYGQPTLTLGTEYQYDKNGVTLVFIVRDTVQSVEYRFDKWAQSEN